MTTAATLSGPGRKIICDKCGNSLLAPEFSEDFGEEQLVIRFWSCKNCGNQFESEAIVPINAKRKFDGKVTGQ
jgi:ribosomal protein L37AE/L43A